MKDTRHAWWRTLVIRGADGSTRLGAFAGPEPVPGRDSVDLDAEAARLVESGEADSVIVAVVQCVHRQPPQPVEIDTKGD